MSPRLNFALNLAYRAGKTTLAIFDTTHLVEFKGDSSPVTVADREAEQLIRKAIGTSYPGEGILGEEEGATGDQGTKWVVDPIDGTKAFICGVPLYATLISFERDGVPQMGVCYFPALDQMVYAEAGEGTFLNGRVCKVSTQSSMARATLCCGSHVSMEKYGRSAGFMELARRSLTTRTWGDAYGHALVASGRVEGMVDPVVNRWDVSALQVIVREAGGEMSDFDGGSNPSTQAVSSNGLLHEEILRSFA